ncbi:MAG: shikimate kinase [Bacteroidales bacterium]|nr:shikimate kinase [Bacteroidales bacterium]
MRIYLIGYKCSGKTTFGKMLAPKLGLQFIDLDDEIENYYGLSIPDLYNKYGEKEFRAIEQKTFHQLPKNKDFILATGGGFPRWETNIELLIESGLTIYIMEKTEVLYQRMNEVATHRPVLLGMQYMPLWEYLVELRQKNDHIYEKAHITFDAQNNTLLQLEYLIKGKTKN